jgi:hypothetical protein
MQRRIIAFSWIALGALVLAPPVCAQQRSRCHVICAPSFHFQPSFVRTHIFGSPTVRSLTTGQETTLPAVSALQLGFSLLVPTVIPRTSLSANIYWFPNAAEKANPYTEYTASEIPGQHIRANSPSVSLLVNVNVIARPQTSGVFALTAYGGDQFGPAAEPNDQGAYTHKLEVGVTASVDPFIALSSTNYLHDVAVFGVIDYRLTGLPGKGDEVPMGERIFLTGAKPATLTIGLDFPIAPLNPSG